MLRASARADEDALWEAVKAKAFKRTLAAEERLRVRGRTESEEMKRILEAQRTAIARELAARKQQEEDAKQMKMPWAPEERGQRAQYEADTRHIQARLASIDGELELEPARIRALYEVKQVRVERVGLVYLWPTTS